MQVTHVAVSPDRTVHKLTEEGCNNLKSIHKRQLVKGWEYGPLQDTDALIAKIAGASNPETKKVLDENETLKQKIADLQKQLAEKPEPKVAEATINTTASVHWATIAGAIAKAETIEDAKEIAGSDTRPGVIAALDKRIFELSKQGDANA